MHVFASATVTVHILVLPCCRLLAHARHHRLLSGHLAKSSTGYSSRSINESLVSNLLSFHSNSWTERPTTLISCPNIIGICSTFAQTVSYWASSGLWRSPLNSP
ncbi:hypothetical protein Pst134EA_005495 [Puccinia striiformis f. sp. tritici]|uniref:hypothetical protein n=1 Tax=Puccinia striiformis f. sp. tritici TaxID=168172 RepID=UPI002007BED3|nr:hypothetical protein Pst134EA_005495 [Puccinia striiformis f. sp. tritici]KAH9471604.1 hypothetical protein Pst134EA_005495 [Puccinia striiformis f. sp. tritici]